MPLPAILIAAAAVTGIAGIGSGVHGGIKIKSAKDRETAAKALHKESEKMFETIGARANKAMDSLGTYELETLASFERFSNVIEKIQNRPEFAEIEGMDAELPDFDSDEFKNLFVGAKALLGGLSSAAAGVAGGVAASGATTAIVTALCTASTGTAISTLSGAAATNAVLATLGGGSLAAGGGGMALGTAVLGAAAGGAALLVGGVIINAMGSKLAKDAEELERQIEGERQIVGEACNLLERITATARTYERSMAAVRAAYEAHIDSAERAIVTVGKTDWNDFDDQEKLTLQNTVLLVHVLYNMCKVNLVIDDDDDGITDRVNKAGIDAMLTQADKALEAVADNSNAPLLFVSNFHEGADEEEGDLGHRRDAEAKG